MYFKNHRPSTVLEALRWASLEPDGLNIMAQAEVYGRAGALGSVHPGEAGAGLAL
jgi:hypothetical protein